MKTIDFVIPLYKSKLTIEPLVDRLNEWTIANCSNFDLTVIFVEDGSMDGTYDFLLEQKNRMQFKFKAIRLAKNYGQHTAISIGLRNAESELIAVMDDDLQHDPFELEKLIQTMDETQADLVYGAYKAKQHHVARNLSSSLLKRLTKSKKVNYSQVTSFKLMKSAVLSIVKYSQSPVVLVDVYLLEGASKVETCEVNHAKRVAGKSTYSSWKLLKMSLGIILFHTSLPLKFIVQLGIGMSVVFFCLSIYYIYQKLMYDVSVGFTSIIVAIFLSTGLILVSLGIIGEYIRRIWVHQNKLNQVLIAEKQE